MNKLRLPVRITVKGRLSDELLNGEIFDTVKESQVLIEQWRIEYNTIRPHCSLGYSYLLQKHFSLVTN
jgi:transposase InsO family protein